MFAVFGSVPSRAALMSCSTALSWQSVQAMPLPPWPDAVNSPVVGTSLIFVWIQSPKLKLFTSVTPVFTPATSAWHTSQAKEPLPATS